MTRNRLQGPAEINSHHPVAGKSGLALTPRAMKGALTLNRNCTVFCRCVVSLAEPTLTVGHCQTWGGSC